MGVSFVNGASGQVGGSSISFSYTVGSGSNRCLTFVNRDADGASVTTSNAKYNGVDLVAATTYNNVQSYSLAAPASGSNTLSANLSSYGGVFYAIADWTGVDQTTPLSSATTASGSSSAPSSGSITITADELIWAVEANAYTGGGSFSAGSGSTFIASVRSGGSGRGLAHVYRNTTGAATINIPGSTSWDLIAYIIRAVAASGSTGTLARTLGNDTSSASGTTTVLGTLARTLSGNTSSAVGTTTVLGTLARTLGNDTLAASGSVGSPASGSLSRTLGNDTLSAQGTTTVRGTVTRTLANDTSSAAGTTTVTGTLARNLGNDTLAASGSSGSAVAGSLSRILGNDTLVASGTTTILGTGAPTTGADTLASLGTITVLGTLARTLGNDTLVATGVSGTPASGQPWRFLKLVMTKLGL